MEMRVQCGWDRYGDGDGDGADPGSPLQEHPLVVLGSPLSPQPLSHGRSPVPPSEPRDDGGTSPRSRDHMQLSGRRRCGVAITHPIDLGIRGLVGDSRGRTSPTRLERGSGDSPQPLLCRGTLASMPAQPWRGLRPAWCSRDPPYRGLSRVWGVEQLPARRLYPCPWRGGRERRPAGNGAAGPEGRRASCEEGGTGRGRQ